MVGIIIGFMWGIGFGVFIGGAIVSWMHSVGNLEEEKYETFEKSEPKKRRCVMCNGILNSKHESKKWIGAHQWCEDYA